MSDPIKVGGSFTCGRCGQWSDGSDYHQCDPAIDPASVGEPKLLSCPFCGCTAAWGEGEQKLKYGNEQVYCISCCASTAPEMTKDEAAQNWNSRAAATQPAPNLLTPEEEELIIGAIPLQSGLLATQPATEATPEQIVYNTAQRDRFFRKHMIEQLTAMGDEQDRGPLRTIAPATEAKCKQCEHVFCPVCAVTCCGCAVVNQFAPATGEGAEDLDSST